MNLSSLSSSVSYREKSAWISLGVVLAVFVPYFVFVFRAFQSDTLSAGEVMGAFIGATILIIILQIALHIAAAVLSPPESVDERDRAIVLRSLRIAYGILLVSGFSAIGTIVILALPNEKPRLPWLEPVFLSQVFFLCLVLAEIEKYGMQIFCYRRGS